MTASNFGWYCPDCGTNHANTTAACMGSPRWNTAGGQITDPAPFTGYGFRKCRGHFHVCHYDNGVEGPDLSIPGDPFKTAEAALIAADALNRGEEPNTDPSIALSSPTATSPRETETNEQFEQAMDDLQQAQITCANMAFHKSCAAITNARAALRELYQSALNPPSAGGPPQ